MPSISVVLSRQVKAIITVTGFGILNTTDIGLAPIAVLVAGQAKKQRLKTSCAMFVKFVALKIWILIALWSPYLAEAQEALNWADLAGTWRGDGTLRASPDAPLEHGACRFDVLTATEQSLRIAGRCATAALAGTISTHLIRTSGGDISGQATSSLVNEPISIFGSQTGTTLSLSSVEPVVIEGEVYRVASRLVGLAADGTFSLVQQTTKQGEGPVIILQMRFRRIP